MSDQKSEQEKRLAIEGGNPVRTDPLPLEFPGAHHFDEEEVQSVVDVLRSRSLFRYYGIDPQRQVEQLESELAEFLGVRHALAVSSGTGALHTAMAALRVGPGQEIVIPAYLWVAVASAVVNSGAVPVLADIDRSFCLDPEKLESYITDKTTGIVLVHMSGAPGKVEAIREIASRRRLFLLEDCAQCAGGSVKGRKVGTFGDIGIFSFQTNKNMTAGEGGCVVTNDPVLRKRAMACHDSGYARDEQGRLILNDPDLWLWGRGYRMDELRAAVLRVQLKKLPRITGMMRGSKYRIRQTLEAYPQVQLRSIDDPEGDTGAFLITTYETPDLARKINEALRAEGIMTCPQGVSNILMTRWGLHLYYNIPSLTGKTSVDSSGAPWSLPANRGLGGNYGKGACPVADSLFERSILLAIPSCLTTRDEDDIIEAFGKVLDRIPS
jgi:dTDP-4-amino-4,6-dideoxygalactose transaminase